LQNRDNPAEFVFIEEWANDSAIDAHFATAHMQAAFSKAAHLLASAPDIRRYPALNSTTVIVIRGSEDIPIWLS
jgi:quinol monooxygenase YgiN